ncbi:MAG: hypothetical protein HY943_04895 [Gammaproteobacteria bacterium]|nr:hypothetical protein [Gammaproteobacteria bacterium]
MDNTKLLEFQSVQDWMKGLHEHWGGDPVNDDPDRLPTLAGFCAFANVDPDTAVKECKRIDKAGDVRISVKGRRKYSELIDEFQAKSPGSKLQRAKRGNTVRSFLIHNGILLQAGAQMHRVTDREDEEE